MLILGTEYAGEMKKGIFSVMHYMMPCREMLTLHSGCNVGRDDDVTLFFGLSGTGADPDSSSRHPRTILSILSSTLRSQPVRADTCSPAQAQSFIVMRDCRNESQQLSVK